MASMLEVYERIKGRDYSQQNAVLGRPSARQALNAPLAGETNIENEQQLHETYEPEKTGMPSEILTPQTQISQGYETPKQNALDKTAQGLGYLKSVWSVGRALSQNKNANITEGSASAVQSGAMFPGVLNNMTAQEVSETMGTPQAGIEYERPTLSQPSDLMTGDADLEASASDVGEVASESGDSAGDSASGWGDTLGRVAGGLLAAYKLYKLTQNKDNTAGDYATTGASVVEAIYPNPYTEAILWGEGARKTGQSLQQQKTALPKTTGHAMSGGMSDAILYMFGKDKDEKSQAFLQYTGADPGHWAESIMTDVSSGHIRDAGETFVSGGLNKVKDKCIIVTACTSADSEEVNISREYRDKFLTVAELRGYYMIAEKVVPIIQESHFAKRVMKKILVDNLIEYGRYALGRGDYPSLISRIITRSFLSLCRNIGSKRDLFVRSNGEVV